jgi:uncharacterized membrane protein
MTARLIAAIAGLFYLITGLWAFADPGSFAGQVATYSPFNRHLLHDSGAFSVGLGLVLIISAWTAQGLVPALGGVLGASLLHLLAHIEDIGLGGHPATDIPVLALVCAALAVGILFASRRRTRAGAQSGSRAEGG